MNSAALGWAMFKISYQLISVFAFAAMISNGANAASEFPAKVHFLSDNYVCGEMANGATTCFDWKLGKIQTVDSGLTTIADIRDVYVGGNTVCAKDTEGVKCSYEVASLPLRELLAKSRPRSVKTSSYSACGVEANGNLLCLVPEWYSTIRKSFREKPAVAIGSIAQGYEKICWVDGDVLACRSAESKDITKLAFKNAFEIALPGRLCARSTTEAKCWDPSGELTLSEDFLTAKKWITDEASSLCALTADERFVCADWTTGTPEPSTSRKIPPAFSTPQSGLTDMWMVYSQTYCGVFGQSKVASCWDIYSSLAFDITFSDDINGFASPMGSTLCVLLKSGKLECRSKENVLYRFLPKAGGLRAMQSQYSTCRWNDAGLVCPEARVLEHLTELKAFEFDEDSKHFCAIGKDPKAPTASPTVHCSLDSTLENIPVTFSKPSAVSVAGDKACAIDSANITCWGNTYNGEPKPTDFSGATRVVLGREHACAIDSFGLVCWGDLTKYNLTIPRGLADPGAVIDVALGANRTCALLANQTVQCWGDMSAYNESETAGLTGVTSLLGSRQHAFCAKNATGYHCWGGDTSFPK